MPKPASHPWRLGLDQSLGSARWRALASAALAPFWPVRELPAGRLTQGIDETGPSATELAAEAPEALLAPLLREGDTRDRLAHRIAEGPFDIDPLSGALFSEGRLTRPDVRPRELLATPAARPDLTRRLRLRRIPREPSLPLYTGAEVSLGAFLIDVLPRFFAIEALALPRDLLLLVSVRMGMLPQFQDALNDGLFRPRPVELMRQGRVVQAQTVHLVDRPLLRGDIHARLHDRLATLYGLPKQPGGSTRTVVLATGGRTGLATLIARSPELRARVEEDGARIIDPRTLPLRDLVASLWGADTVIAPECGEAAAFLLAGPTLRQLVLVASANGTSPDPRPWLMARAMDLDCIRTD